MLRLFKREMIKLILGLLEPAPNRETPPRRMKLIDEGVQILFRGILRDRRLKLNLPAIANRPNNRNHKSEFIAQNLCFV